MTPQPLHLLLEEVPGLEKEGNHTHTPRRQVENPLIFKPGRHRGGSLVLSPSQSHSDKEGKQEITILTETPGEAGGDIAPWCSYVRWTAARTEPGVRSGSSCAASLRLRRRHCPSGPVKERPG